jgi:hypothetical protein
MVFGVMSASLQVGIYDYVATDNGFVSLSDYLSQAHRLKLFVLLKLVLSYG